MADMLSDGLTYPFEGDSWAKTILIGGGLVFFSFLLLPAFASYGYLLDVLRSTADGDGTAAVAAEQPVP